MPVGFPFLNAVLGGGNIFKPVTVTGTTASMFLTALTVPPNLCQPGYHIRCTGLFSGTNANNKTFQVYINDGGGGGMGGGTAQIMNAGGIGLSGMMVFESQIYLRDAYTQMGGPINSTSGFGTVTSSPTVYNCNMTNGLDIVVRVALTTATDRLTMEAFSYEVSSL